MNDITKSMKMQEQAKRLIPGMSQLLSKRPDQFSYGVWPGYYSKAKGCEVWDLDGNHYIDMSISGIGANVLGYADPDVDAAVCEAIAHGSSSSLNCPEEVELAELLCSIHPWADMARFTRTGGESVAVAVRIARTHTGRDKVAFCGYHGWHDWYLSANIGTENALGGHLIDGLSPKGVPSALGGTALPFRYNQLEDLEKIVAEHGNNLAAIVMEPIRNDQPLDSFRNGVRSLADKTGAVLIIDEISAGFRMNTGGAHLVLGMKPDMAVFSKALGNGYPIGAVIGRKEVMQSAQDTFISSTCWTERVGPVAALAMIKKHESCNAGVHLMALGQAVQEGWNSCAERHSLDISVGGIYPLGHFSFNDDHAQILKALFVQEMLDRGFLASTLFYTMLAHEERHVAQYLKAVDEVFKILAKVISDGSFDDKLRGLPASSGFKRLI